MVYSSSKTSRWIINNSAEYMDCRGASLEKLVQSNLLHSYTGRRSTTVLKRTRKCSSFKEHTYQISENKQDCLFITEMGTVVSSKHI